MAPRPPIRGTIPVRVNLEFRPIPREEKDIRKETRYQELMQQAQLDPSVARIQAVVNYLSQEDYYGPVLDVLDCLDGSRVPKSIPAVDDDEFAHVLGARKALLQSSGYFRMLFHCPDPSTEVLGYVQRCIKAILERWEGVCKCMTYLVVNDIEVVQCQGPGYADVAGYSSTVTALRNCVDTLTAIFTSGAGYLLVELASLPCTVNLLCAVLSHVDPSTGKYEMWDTYFDPGAKCTVTELLHICWKTPTGGRDVVVLHFKSQKRRARQKVLSALVRRAQQMVEDADTKTVAGYALSISRLAGVMIALSAGLNQWTELYGANILPDLAGALTSIVEKAHSVNLRNRDCWNRLSEAPRFLAWSSVGGTLNPVYCLSLLMGSGLLTAALLCLHHQDDPNALPERSSFSVGSLEVIVPYLYHEEVFLAALKRPGVWGIIGAPPRTCGSNGYPKIWADMWMTIYMANAAHRGRMPSPVCLCSNTKHSERYGLTNYAVWVCNRCRWMTYCSSECQEEDWYRIHKYECRGFSQSELVQAERSSSARALITARRSQVVYLQEVLNREELQYMDHLHTAHTQSCLNPHTPQIPLFRLPDTNFIMGTMNIDEPGFWSFQPPCYTPGEGGELWERRYTQFIEEFRNDEQSMLCEGFFPHPHKLGMAMRVLVRVKCFADTEGNRRWRVVNHAFRVA